MYLKSSLIITTIMLLISCGDASKNEAIDEAYGTLRIPVLAECPVNLKELERLPYTLLFLRYVVSFFRYIKTWASLVRCIFIVTVNGAARISFL